MLLTVCKVSGMKDGSVTDRLAVCSWSLQPPNPGDLIEKIRASGLHRVQLALDPLREAPAVWGDTSRQLSENGISMVSGMFGCVGEDYTTPETIRRTGGIAPDATWEQNLQNIRATAILARKLNLKLVTFHAGFLPHEESDPNAAKMLGRLAQVADVFGQENMALGLETGQETAPILLEFLLRLKKPQIGVNFDPANMILYEKGDPIEAVRLLGPWIRQVHIKDARLTKSPGTWGEEVPAGTGDVNWRAFFPALNEAGFTGDFVIEREAGDQRLQDISAARELIARLAD